MLTLSTRFLLLSRSRNTYLGTTPFTQTHSVQAVRSLSIVYARLCNDVCICVGWRQCDQMDRLCMQSLVILNNENNIYQSKVKIFAKY